jgi:hypothetical protein
MNDCGLVTVVWDCGLVTVVWDCGLVTVVWDCGLVTVVWDCGFLTVVWDCGLVSVVWDCGLMTVVWDTSKIYLFCTVGIEAVLYDCYYSACMSLLWWLKNIWWCVFYDLAAISTACINSMIEHVACNEASCVVSPLLLMCGSITSVVMTYIHAFLQRFALWFSVVDEEYGDTVVG